jgi:hypothetical protein
MYTWPANSRFDIDCAGFSTRVSSNCGADLPMSGDGRVSLSRQRL